LGHIDKEWLARLGKFPLSFIQETVKVFDADSLVIAASSDMNIDVQNCTDQLEEAFESAAIIDNNQSAKADF
jgi:hypothetical protein